MLRPLPISVNLPHSPTTVLTTRNPLRCVEPEKRRHFSIWSCEQWDLLRDSTKYPPASSFLRPSPLPPKIVVIPFFVHLAWADPLGCYHRGKFYASLKGPVSLEPLDSSCRALPRDIRSKLPRFVLELEPRPEFNDNHDRLDIMKGS